MKKRSISIIFLMIIAVVTLLFGIVGCNKNNNSNKNGHIVIKTDSLEQVVEFGSDYVTPIAGVFDDNQDRIDGRTILTSLYGPGDVLLDENNPEQIKFMFDSQGVYKVVYRAYVNDVLDTKIPEETITIYSCMVLGTPENFQVSDGTLSWNPVDNASGYEVTINGDHAATLSADETSFKSDVFGGTGYYVSVTAKGDHTKYYIDSAAGAYKNRTPLKEGEILAFNDANYELDVRDAVLVGINQPADEIEWLSEEECPGSTDGALKLRVRSGNYGWGVFKILLPDEVFIDTNDDWTGMEVRFKIDSESYQNDTFFLLNPPTGLNNSTNRGITVTKDNNDQWLIMQIDKNIVISEGYAKFKEIPSSMYSYSDGVLTWNKNDDAYGYQIVATKKSVDGSIDTATIRNFSSTIKNTQYDSDKESYSFSDFASAQYEKLGGYDGKTWSVDKRFYKDFSTAKIENDVKLENDVLSWKKVDKADVLGYRIKIDKVQKVTENGKEVTKILDSAYITDYSHEVSVLDANKTDYSVDIKSASYKKYNSTSGNYDAPANEFYKEDAIYQATVEYESSIVEYDFKVMCEIPQNYSNLNFNLYNLIRTTGKGYVYLDYVRLYKDKIATPENFRYENGKILWDTSTDVDKYTLNIVKIDPEFGDDSTHYVVEGNKGEFDLSTIGIDSSVKFSAELRAIPTDTTKASSDWATFDTVLPATGLNINDQDILSWTAVDHAISYVVKINDTEGNTLTFQFYVTGNYDIPKADNNFKIYIDYVNYYNQLDTPKNLAITGGTLSWNAVDGATGYVVNVNGVDKGTVSTNSFGFTNYLSATYAVKVKAINGVDVDSGWSNALSKMIETSPNVMSFNHKAYENTVTYLSTTNVSPWTNNGTVDYSKCSPKSGYQTGIDGADGGDALYIQPIVAEYEGGSANHAIFTISLVNALDLTGTYAGIVLRFKVSQITLGLLNGAPTNSANVQCIQLLNPLSNDNTYKKHGQNTGYAYKAITMGDWVEWIITNEELDALYDNGATSISFAIVTDGLNYINANAVETYLDYIKYVNILDAPENLSLSGNTLSWNAVSGATEYVVNVNGVDKGTVSTNSFDFTNYLSATYAVKVKAINGVDVDSGWSNALSKIVESNPNVMSFNHKAYENSVTYLSTTNVSPWTNNGTVDYSKCSPKSEYQTGIDGADGGDALYIQPIVAEYEGGGANHAIFTISLVNALDLTGTYDGIVLRFKVSQISLGLLNGAPTNSANVQYIQLLNPSSNDNTYKKHGPNTGYAYKAITMGDWIEWKITNAELDALYNSGATSISYAIVTDGLNYINANAVETYLDYISYYND